MGAQLKGAARTLQECNDLKDLYVDKYHDYISQQLQKIRGSQPSRDRTFGVEIELVGVNDTYDFRRFDESQFRPNYAPEILTE